MPKWLKIRIIVLILVFIASVIILFFALNFQPSEQTSEMTAPTLPTVTLSSYGHQMSTLYGYKDDMDVAYMRSQLVPLDDSRVLPVTINAYDNTIKDASYEIRTLDGSSKVDQADLDLTHDGETYTASPTLVNLIDPGREYILKISVSTKNQDISYYTRIAMCSDYHISDLMDFAADFHDKSISGNYDSLSQYLESTDDESDDSITDVTIHSPLDLVGWKDFNIDDATDPQITVNSSSEEYTVMNLYYFVTSDKKEYAVDEYFKISYGESRNYLLDYERKLSACYTLNEIAASDNRLDIGAQSDDINMLSNETGSIAAFVEYGSLYEYNQSGQSLTSVFSFYDSLSDERAVNDDHDIKILNIDESGTMDFIVYGYFNSGEHEGESGINVYHYDSSRNRVEEEAFIVSDKPYDVMKNELSDLMYRTTDGRFYSFDDGTLFEINLQTLEKKEIVSGLTDDRYAVSQSGRYVAWADTEIPSASITVADLSTDSQIDTHTIQADDGDVLIPLGFLNEYLIYGVAHQDDINSYAQSKNIIPMYKLEIVALSGKKISTIKEYSKKGRYVTNVKINSAMDSIALKRVRKSGSTYIRTSKDTILSSYGTDSSVSQVSGKDDNDQITTFIEMKELSAGDQIVSIGHRTADFILRSVSSDIELKASKPVTRYYTYCDGEIVYSGTDQQKALSYDGGTVLSSEGKYLE